MNKLATFFAVPVFGLALSAAAWADVDTAEKMTLREAISTGILKNPEYRSAAEESLATREQLSQARAGYLPSVDLTGQSGRERTGGPTIGGNPQTLWHNSTSLTLTQLLFDGWNTKNEINRQKARVESTAGHAGEVAEFTGLDITEAYLDVLRQRELFIIARGNVDDHMAIQEKIQTGVKGGTITQGDLMQVDARLAQARATLAQTEEDLRHAESLFNQKVGVMPPGYLVAPHIPRKELPPNVEDAVGLALAGSPTLAVSDSDIKAAEAEYKGSQSSLYPRVDIEANSSMSDDISGIPGSGNSQSVLAVMKWNLYRGGADIDRERELMHRHAETREKRDQVARQVEKDMRDTWAGMVSANARAQEFEGQAEDNERVVDVYFAQFSINRRTLLDVLNAQGELFSSRSNSINAAYAADFAVFRVMALRGYLLELLQVPRPRETVAMN